MIAPIVVMITPIIISVIPLIDTMVAPTAVDKELEKFWPPALAELVSHMYQGQPIKSIS